MKWSVNASKTFFQCPKKWYYEAMYAKSKDTNPERREAYLLKHLQSIYSWRGKLVDQVITRFVVPKMNNHKRIDASEVLDYANSLMKVQLSFAKAKMYRNVDAKTSAYNYCALLELESNNSLNEESIEQIGKEAMTSLLNLLSSRLINQLVEDGLYFIAQRPLQFRFVDISVKCTPDLIAFFKDKPPTIIDWKVESLGYREHWLQLGIYGVALSRVIPHKDFPCEWCNILTDPTKISLVEFQLLKNREVEYNLTFEDITDIEDYIYLSSMRMQQMTDGNKTPAFIINTLPKAKSPETCLRCKFKKICWRERIS